MGTVYSATNLIPNGTSILSSTPNTIYWNFQGTNTQTDYQVQIYKNSDNSLAYDSTKLTSSAEQHIVPGATLSDNLLYKFRVTTWDGANTAISNWVLFYTQSSATLTISATPTISQTFEFPAIYSQANDISLKTYQAFLYLGTDLVNPIDESGIIYPSTLIQNGDTITWSFDGLASGIEYGVQFTGETQYGEIIDSGIVTFTVTYAAVSSIPLLTVTPINSDGYMQLDWIKMLQVLGVVDGTYSYDVSGKFDKGLQLDYGSELYYTEDIPEDYSFIGWFKLSATFTGNVIKLLNSNTNDYFRIFFTGTKFGMEIGDFLTVGKNASALLETWILLGVKHGKLIIVGSGYEETISG